ncbi:hypothetical protein PHAVU_008G218700 [Phaseolus vulgaris]
MFNVFFGDIGNSIRMEANSFTHIPNTENSTVAAATNLDNAPNPTSPSPPVPSTPSLKAPSLHADSITPSSIQIVDVEASEPVQPISAVHSLRPSSTKRKNDKGKAVAVPVCSTLNLKISDSRKKNGEFEGSILSKTKTSTFPRAKKQRTFLSSKDAKREKYIKKQKTYFKEMDAWVGLPQYFTSI